MQNIGQHKYHYYFDCLPEGEEEQLQQQTSNYYMGENRINYGYESNETSNSTPPIFTLKFLPSSSTNIFGGEEGNFKTWSGGAGVSAITVNNKLVNKKLFLYF
ncbi:unnamed protein product [Meloidogyne enterolobii]|uniref:Uncharacterized protein n=1 Tax=Meloidogyne enterolobii TaxID=390850 RepID=A0ACB0Y286_MELEN